MCTSQLALVAAFETRTCNVATPGAKHSSAIIRSLDRLAAYDGDGLDDERLALCRARAQMATVRFDLRLLYVFYSIPRTCARRTRS